MTTSHADHTHPATKAARALCRRMALTDGAPLESFGDEPFDEADYKLTRCNHWPRKMLARPIIVMTRGTRKTAHVSWLETAAAQLTKPRYTTRVATPDWFSFSAR